MARAVMLCGAVMVLLLGAFVPGAAATEGPVQWAPADSTYDGTHFVSVAAPAPPGTGMTVPAAPPSLDGVAFGSGYLEAAGDAFSFGFLKDIHMTPGTPSLAETDLSGTSLVAGTALKLVFTKDAGQKICSVAIIGDPDAKVALDYAPAPDLATATRFTVWATVTDPVASASGNVPAAFGLIMDLSTDPARDYGGSLFVSDMHWLDVKPPSFTSSGMAGLSASGSSGVTATFDGIFAPVFLTSMGITDPSQVEGYVDVTAITGWAGATFEARGAGDGSLWPDGFYKYRITNSSWSKHDILFGRMSAPLKAAGTSPKGTISGTRPTFKWRKLAGATAYEVRVYKGAKLLQKRAGCAALSWKAAKALPRGVYLTWKVRGGNSAGRGAWSTALKFKIR